MQIKYFDKSSLVTANNEAIQEGRNRSLETNFVANLEDDLVFPVFMAMDHNQVEMRLGLMVGPETKVWLDVSYEGYESLPTIDMPTH